MHPSRRERGPPARFRRRELRDEAPESSFREGFGYVRNATGLLTRGSLSRRLPGQLHEAERQWHVGGRASPLTAAGPSRTRTGFPHRVPGVGRAYHRTVSETGDATLHTAAPGHRVLRLWLPVVAWALVIFALSSVPHLGTDLGVWDTILRKLAHTFEYAVLGALLTRA